MRSAVSELSRALARLFEMIRTDRRQQTARIAELERELAAARAQLADLGVEPVAPPAPNDFDQLRAAAERLRVRTEQLVREAAEHTPVDREPQEQPGEPADDSEMLAAQTVGPDVPSEPAAPAILRVLPGTGPAADLAVESELAIDEPAAAPQSADDDAAALPDAAAVAVPVRPVPPDVEPQHATEPVAAEPLLDSDASPTVPPRAPEPVTIEPRPARKRSVGLRRRRIDARKLAEVEPTAALGSMVAAIPQLWTAGFPLDLVIAFFDGGAVRVTGGDREPLRVEEVQPGIPARCTVTATRRQLVPLFGRLELTDAESAPMIHGSRRDADLLVAWIDRAQRLSAQPL